MFHYLLIRSLKISNVFETLEKVAKATLVVNYVSVLGPNMCCVFNRGTIQFKFN